MKYHWPDLAYWKSGEFQVVQDMLHDMDRKHEVYNPARKDLFKALELTSLENAKVVFLSQDPYPSHTFATGLAFSVPAKTTIPPSLATIFKEYVSDLHYSAPVSGDLSHWAAQGVLLWNAVPSCAAGKSLSHDIPEWKTLTVEILSKTSAKGIPHVFIGSFAKTYAQYVNDGCEKIFLAHPSPRAGNLAKHPFQGSRIFSTINDKLKAEGLGYIDWKLS